MNRHYSPDAEPEIRKLVDSALELQPRGVRICMRAVEPDRQFVHVVISDHYGVQSPPLLLPMDCDQCLIQAAVALHVRHSQGITARN